MFGRPDLVPAISIGAEALLSMNDPRAQAACIPGGGGRARAADVALVYQGFLADDSPWGRDAIGTVRNASLNIGDNTPANRTVAGVVAGDDGYADLRWFPSGAPRVFGHHGAGGQLCWLDPDLGLSFCFLHDTLEQHLAEGKSVVMQLVTTAESILDRRLGQLAPDERAELDIDLSPREFL